MNRSNDRSRKIGRSLAQLRGSNPTPYPVALRPSARIAEDCGFNPVSSRVAGGLLLRLPGNEELRPAESPPRLPSVSSRTRRTA